MNHAKISPKTGKPYRIPTQKQTAATTHNWFLRMLRGAIGNLVSANYRRHAERKRAGIEANAQQQMFDWHVMQAISHMQSAWKIHADQKQRKENAKPRNTE